jgi:hypothetical protein
MFINAVSLRVSIEALIANLKAVNDESGRVQVSLKVEIILGQIRRLRIPISHKGSGGTFTAAEQQGLDSELLSKIENLAARSEFALMQGRQPDAVSMAEQALRAWIDAATSRQRPRSDPVRLHPLDHSVKCHYCGKGDLVFVRPRHNCHLYRCTAEIPCKPYTVHSRHDGVCGVGGDAAFGLTSLTWVECAGHDPAKRE